MLCDRCKKNEARINIVQIINGKKKQLSLCEECMQHISGTSMFSGLPEEVSENLEEIMKDLLVDIEKHMSGEDIDLDTDEEPAAVQVKENKEKMCPICRTTLKEFEKRRTPGCYNCYKVFRDEISTVMHKGNKENAEYSGRVPHQYEEEIEYRNSLKKLKQKFYLAVKNEEFEKAGDLNKKIKAIEEKIIESNLSAENVREEESSDV